MRAFPEPFENTLFLFSASSSSSSLSTKGFHPFEVAANVSGGQGKSILGDVLLGLCQEAGRVRQNFLLRKEFGKEHIGETVGSTVLYMQPPQAGSQCFLWVQTS